MVDFDLHLYGPIFSATGVGESTRSYWRALTGTGLKVGIIPQSSPHDNTELDIAHLYAKNLVDKPHDKLNLFRINAQEINSIPSHLIKFGAATKNILIPMWETAKLPKVWLHEVRKFDAIFCATNFIMDAFDDVSEEIPRYLVWHPVYTNFLDIQTKRSLSVRDDLRLITYSFAYSSRVERKNPLDFLNLYKFRNLELGIKDEQYILLCSDEPQDDSGRNVHEILTKAKGSLFDYRVGGRTRTEHLSLLANSDVFVSPHRSEGIGLQLVEAATLDTPFVTHRYSGPRDFVPVGYSGVVPYTLKQIGEGEYPNASGQEWASCKIHDISNSLNNVFSKNPKDDEHLDLIEFKFSFLKSMESMKNALKNL